MLNALFYPGEDKAGTKIPFDKLFVPYIYQEIYFDGIYLDVVNQLEHGGKKKEDITIVDIGANIGVVTQYLRDFGKVYSVEPSGEHFEALKKNKDFNKWDNVEVFNYAISDKDGEADLRLFDSNRTSHSIVFQAQEGEEVDHVKTKSMTSFFKDAGIKHVDFMKFDVEGAEELILPSDDFKEALQMIDNIEIEFHFPDFTKHVNALIKAGYTARRYNCSAIVIDFQRNR